MIRRTLASVVLVALALALPAGAQQYITLGPGTWANDVTPDGNIVAGTWPGGGFIWNWRTDPAPNVILGGDIYGISDDGTVAVGNMSDPGTGEQVAGRWTEATGWVSLGGFSSCQSISSGYDVSGDGSTVVGLAWVNGCDAHGFVWTEATGMQALDSLANGVNRASAISGDGSVIGGFAQGNFSRTPALWNPADLTGSVLDADQLGEYYGFNEDGTIALGASDGGDPFIAPKAFYEIGGVRTSLGGLNGANWTSIPEDVTQDGSVIVGFDTVSLSREAWIWTEASGIVSLANVLTALGFPGEATPYVCRGVSEDGNVVVGGQPGSGGPFGFGAFILELSGEDTFADLEGGTAGANGIPQLSATGSLLPNSLFSMNLAGAPANAQMLAWISLTSNPTPAFGGTVHAFPPNAEFYVPADANGEFSATSHWPSTIPSNTELYFQFLIGDASALPWGITLSNGLQATTP